MPLYVKKFIFFGLQKINFQTFFNSSTSSSRLYLTRVKHLIVYNTNKLVALNLKVVAITNMIYNKIKLRYITVSKTVKLSMAIR